eukprot:c29673_g1_i1 orf=414-851(+)
MEFQIGKVAPEAMILVTIVQLISCQCSFLHASAATIDCATKAKWEEIVSVTVTETVHQETKCNACAGYLQYERVNKATFFSESNRFTEIPYSFSRCSRSETIFMGCGCNAIEIPLRHPFHTSKEMSSSAFTPTDAFEQNLTGPNS